MSTPFPATSLDTTTTLPTESANTPLSTNHVIAHTNLADAVIALETKVGVDSSAVATSLDYLLKSSSSSNPGHKHTLANGATDVTSSAAELNILDGATLTVTELNYVDGVTSAIQTQLDLKALDSAVVHDTGDETIAGVKTFSSDPLIPDEAYGSGWNGVLEPPTKNAVYDKIQTLANYDKVLNTSEVDASYITYQIMPVTNATDDITNGWDESAVTIGTDQGGAGVIALTSSADCSLYTKLPGIGSNTYFRFADIGANALRIKFRLKLGTVEASERIGFGLSSTATGFYSARGTFTDYTIRFVMEENSGDKLYSVNTDTSASTNTDVTGALTLTSWHTYEMVITSTSVLFYIDGTLVATHTTNLPTGTSDMFIGFGKEFNGGSSTFMTLAPTLITLPTS